MTRRIAVIGGGAAAALLLAHLARNQDGEDVSVDIYDRTGRFGKGVAYSTVHDCHLLNVRAANMSAFQEDKDDFAQWAATRGYGPQDFVPRKLYGLYLAEKMAAVVKSVPTRYITADVIAAARAGNGYEVFCNGERKLYERVVLATGNVRPLRPHVNGIVDGYYDDPWSADFTRLLTARKIALVGSGLTAVDMVLALSAQGYNGEIFVFSRNALLPEPHVDPATYAPFLSAEDERKSPLELLALIRSHVKKAAMEGLPWQSVIDSLRSHTNPVWKNWSPLQRQQFGKRLMTFWNIHRHRMAPQIAQTVERMRESGQLHMIKAGVRSIGAGPVVDSTAGAFPVDAVINCLGYRYDEDGRSYEVSDRLGPSNFGDLFETTAIPEIRAQAHALAADILSRQ